MTFNAIMEEIYNRFPYLKDIHNPHDFALCLEYEEKKEQNKKFFEKLYKG